MATPATSRAPSRPMAASPARSAHCMTWCWPARRPPWPPSGPAHVSTTRMTPAWPCWRRACSTWACSTATGWAGATSGGRGDDVSASRAYFQFYMHRTSHWLGMDVHDCGSYLEPGEIGQVSQRRDPLTGQTISHRPSRVLRPGMVLTVEPGIYVRPAAGVPEQFHHLGIRIEDDAIVTASGCELITRDVPVQAGAIEALMRD